MQHLGTYKLEAGLMTGLKIPMVRYEDTPMDQLFKSPVFHL